MVLVSGLVLVLSLENPGEGTVVGLAWGLTLCWIGGCGPRDGMHDTLWMPCANLLQVQQKCVVPWLKPVSEEVDRPAAQLPPDRGCVRSTLPA